MSFLLKLWLGCGDFGAILCFYLVVLQGGVRGTLESLIDCRLGSICIFYGMLDFIMKIFTLSVGTFLHFIFSLSLSELIYYGGNC